MNVDAKRELDSIKTALSAEIRELEDISSGLRREFQGIGTERCADVIDGVISKYRTVLRKLNNIDVNDVHQYTAGLGGGGASGSGGGAGTR